ncbi:hypothetical protein JOF53_007069 [Crossiella equi]|uniref:Uncharacterized protein n=1 Tax=Crossiella equi TaxID=130796 RepID=A0ABS5AP71_9PSEU|nr:hypothetical protein [Crossiella equi]MBP2478197.1 hypothetical protein [Crossiella equi]
MKIHIARPEIAAIADLARRERPRVRPLEDVLADVLGAGANFELTEDGAVLIGFGPGRGGAPRAVEPPRESSRLVALTAEAVRAHAVGSAQLLEQLAIAPDQPDWAAVAAQLADRARARAAELAAQAEAAEQRERAAWSGQAVHADRRAALLRELAELDSPAATAEPDLPPRHGWWSR